MTRGPGDCTLFLSRIFDWRRLGKKTALKRFRGSTSRSQNFIHKLLALFMLTKFAVCSYAAWW